MSRTTPTEATGSRESAAEIEQAAADWVALVDRGPLSAEQERALEEWAAADSRRAGAYARAAAANLYLDRAAALGGNFSARPERVQAPLRRRVLAVAASVAIASVTGLGILRLDRRENRPAPRPIATAKGNMRQVALEEGSRITLNTMTQIRAALTRSVRRIDLLQGEALFDVAKDAARPFVVYTGDLIVRAVGTSFSIRRLGDDAIKLLVAEGVVEVRRRDEVLGLVHAGTAFAVDAATIPVLTRLDPAGVARALAWREGRIDLQGMTLAAAAAEFSRYSDIKIRVEDPTVAGLHITGVFATDDTEGFAEAAATSLGLKISKRGNEVYIFRARGADDTRS